MGELSWKITKAELLDTLTNREMNQYKSRCEKLTGGIQTAILLLETNVDTITVVGYLRDTLKDKEN